MLVYENNKKARQNYEFIETIEAGMSLLGAELKSIKAGGLSLRESYVQIKGDEIFLIGAHIKPYVFSGVLSPDPYRERKLLLHKHEILKLASKVHLKGLTLVPVRCYGNAKGKVKLELALAKGRKSFDKRKVEKDKQVARSLDRVMKQQ